MINREDLEQDLIECKLRGQIPDDIRFHFLGRDRLAANIWLAGNNMYVVQYDDESLDRHPDLFNKKSHCRTLNDSLNILEAANVFGIAEYYALSYRGELNPQW